MNNDEEKKDVDLTVQVEDKKINFSELSKKKSSSAVDKISTIILVLICVGLAAYYIFAPAPEREVVLQQEETVSAINVRTEILERDLFQSYTRLNGEIGSNNKDLSIVPDTSGTVTSILVTRGDSVEADQVIAYVDASRPGANYKESPVRSPIAGVITSIPVSVGETVSASSPIATITGEKSLYIEASLPERYRGTASEGMDAVFTSVAYPEDSFTAKISYIAPYIRTTNRTSDIELEITSPSDKLVEGMYVTVDLVTEEQYDVITVPDSAITELSSGTFVYIVENGQAVEKEITTGSSNGSRTVVLSGLEAGDELITAGTVANGSTVNVL